MMKPRESLLLVLLAAIWGGSFLFIRTASPVVGPAVLRNLRVLLAALPLVLYARLFARLPHLWSRWKSYLLLGTIHSVAYLIYFHLMATVGPTSTLSVTFLVPVFGLLWGALFLKEQLTIGWLVGLGIILFSMWCVTNVLQYPTSRS